MRSWGKNCRGYLKVVGATGLVLGLLLLPGAVPVVDAGSDLDAGIVPIDAKTLGRTYDQWAAAWWQWAIRVPADRNPVLDTDGTFAAEGQHGTVWFLAGTFFGTAERTVTVPRNKYLFFPLINFAWLNFPTDPPMDDETIAGWRAYLRSYVDSAALECTIDGVPVENLGDYLTSSPLFWVWYPIGNIAGTDPGVGYPCFDEGYYLMLTPLSLGAHEIHFSATDPEGNTMQDVTYHLTVK